MFLSLLMDLFPLHVVPSSLFCDIQLGQVFKGGTAYYILLERDMMKVKILRWNKLTQFLWRKKINESRSGDKEGDWSCIANGPGRA